MIDYTYANLFANDSVNKQLQILSDDGKVKITNDEIHEEVFELTEGICSEGELQFGNLEASELKFTVSNVFIPMKGKWLTVKVSAGGHTEEPLQLGRYKVYSDTPTADRKCRDVVAYDALYDVINADAAAWYSGLTFPMSLKQFRDSFFGHFGIEQEQITLVNDEMMLQKVVEITGSSDDGSVVGEAMSGKEVLSCILEINGCMGRMGRNGKFHYIYLKQNIEGLYPANDLYPADDLFPQEQNTTKIDNGLYISAEYEDFIVKPIERLQIRQEENDIGVITGDGENTYVIEGNFLVYGKGTDELTTIAQNIFSKIRWISYRPFSADCKGNPCFEVGDAVRLCTKHEIIESYILKRVLKGVQALRDAIEAQGEEYRTQNVNGVQRSILQLKGKSNTLERTIEETRLKIADTETKLQTQISQTAEEIRTEAENTKEGLRTQISQTAEEIATEVTRATGAEDRLSSAIKETAGRIELMVEKGSVRSQFAMEHDSITLSSGTITFDANTLIVKSDFFELESNGTVNARKINATGGTIGGWTITDTKIMGGDSSSGVAVVQMPTDKSTYVFAAGGTTHERYTDCPFRVTKAGKLYAEKAEISGTIVATNLKVRDNICFYLDAFGINAFSKMISLELADDAGAAGSAVYDLVIGKGYGTRLAEGEEYGAALFNETRIKGNLHIGRSLLLNNGHYINGRLAENQLDYDIIGISTGNNLHLGSGLFDNAVEGCNTYVSGANNLNLRTKLGSIRFYPKFTGTEYTADTATVEVDSSLVKSAVDVVVCGVSFLSLVERVTRLEAK